jgi:hypothetical protein
MLMKTKRIGSWYQLLQRYQSSVSTKQTAERAEESKLQTPGSLLPPSIRLREQVHQSTP